jgi:hypothetical protein
VGSSVDNDRELFQDSEMEAKVAKLENAVEYMQRDISEIKTDLLEIRKDFRTYFHLLFGAIIAVALGLTGLIAKVFHWV